MADALAISGVRKTFGPKVAVDNLDLIIPEGSLCGFIGPNGAGKTTSIRMVMSIIFPDRGQISVLGKPSAIESKDRIGYLPEERGIYRKMKVAGFLKYVGQLKGVDDNTLKRRVPEWLQRVGLLDVARKKCEELSKGMQQKVQFVGTIIHDPDLIILDEPFSGLDPVNMLLLRDLLLELHDQGKTILFSTHVMHQAERLCDRIVMINGGEKVLDGTLDEIRDKFDPRTIEVESNNGAMDVAALRSLPGVIDAHEEKDVIALRCDDGLAADDIIRSVAQMGGARRIEVKRASLEEVFVSIAGASSDEIGRRHEEESADA